MPQPETIGRYQVQVELGHGAMGSVYRATDPIMDRTVAIKTILSGALSGPQAAEYRERFIREARAAGRLTHPGIVTVYDAGETDGIPYLVMEYVNGRTLADSMDAGQRFTFDRIYEIGYQVADALGYAHRNGVVHRDIKPANILLAVGTPGESERAKITDLGVAKLNASQITTTGQLLGTPAFMPPEQFTGAPLDGRADLFSLGVILYWMATGDKPFSGDTITAVSYKIVHSDPAPPRKINPAVPPGLELIIMRCLEKDPSRRYPTGEALAADLASARAGRELMQTTTMPRGTIVPPSMPMPQFDGDPNTTLDSDMRHLMQSTAARPASAPMPADATITGDPGIYPAHAPVDAATAPSAAQGSAHAASARSNRMMYGAIGFVALCLLLIYIGVRHRRSELARQIQTEAEAQAAQQVPTALNSAQPTSAQTGAAAAGQTPAGSPTTDGSASPTSAPSSTAPATQPAPAPQTQSAAGTSANSASSKLAKNASGRRGSSASQSASAPQQTPSGPPQDASAAAATPPPAPVQPQVQPQPAAATQPADSNAAPVPVAVLTGDALNDAAKVHIDDGHVPNGISFIVLMDGKILVTRGVVPDGQPSPLKDDHPVIAGGHEFKVICAPGTMAVAASNTVRDDIKSKKKKTLRIELRDNNTGQTLKKSSKVDPNTAVFVIELKDSSIFGIR